MKKTKVTIELSEEQVESLTKFCLAQTKPEVNPVTGQQMQVPMYESVQDLIIQAVQATVINTSMQLYPPASALADLRIVKEAQERLALRAKPVLAGS